MKLKLKLNGLGTSSACWFMWKEFYASSFASSFCLQWWWIRLHHPCEGFFCKIINFSAIMIHSACFFMFNLSFKLFSTIIAHKIFYLRMSNHMNFKLILSSEALFADCAGKPLLRMKCFNVLPYARILFKSFFTMRTSEIPFSLCS